MAMRGWLPSWPESSLRGRNHVPLSCSAPHRVEHCTLRLHMQLWFDSKEETQQKLVTVPVWGRSQEREQSFIHSIQQIIFCKPIWLKALGQPLRRAIMMNEAQLLASSGCHPLKGRLQQKRHRTGFLSERADLAKGTAGRLRAGGKGTQTGLWKTREDNQATSQKSLEYFREEGTVDLNLTWDCPNYIVKCILNSFTILQSHFH